MRAVCKYVDYYICIHIYVHISYHIDNMSGKNQIQIADNGHIDPS